MDPKALVNLGSAIESTVLARAVKWWAERRVLLVCLCARLPSVG